MLYTLAFWPYQCWSREVNNSARKTAWEAMNHLELLHSQNPSIWPDIQPSAYASIRLATSPPPSVYCHKHVCNFSQHFCCWSLLPQCFPSSSFSHELETCCGTVTAMALTRIGMDWRNLPYLKPEISISSRCKDWETPWTGYWVKSVSKLHFSGVSVSLLAL